jgi:hypothetical protein
MCYRAYEYCLHYNCISLNNAGWANNLENNQYFDKLRARCPRKAIIIEEI